MPCPRSRAPSSRAGRGLGRARGAVVEGRAGDGDGEVGGDKAPGDGGAEAVRFAVHGPGRAAGLQHLPPRPPEAEMKCPLRVRPSPRRAVPGAHHIAVRRPEVLQILRPAEQVVLDEEAGVEAAREGALDGEVQRIGVRGRADGVHVLGVNGHAARGKPEQNLWPANPQVRVVRQFLGPAPEVDDREVLCLAVLEELLGFESDHAFYQWFESNAVLQKLFPRRLTRPNWADRRALLTPLLQGLSQAFCALDGEEAPPFSSSTRIRSMSADRSGPARRNASEDWPNSAIAPR